MLSSVTDVWSAIRKATGVRYNSDYISHKAMPIDTDTVAFRMLDVLDHFNLDQIKSFFGRICDVIKVRSHLLNTGCSGLAAGLMRKFRTLPRTHLHGSKSRVQCKPLWPSYAR